MTKYIFVTGGVVSGLGKGITAASIGRLLKARGLKVCLQKFDPYLNVDCGAMDPIQHGEVFVTEDGAETDLDVGHYERFVDENLNKFSNITTGKIYASLIAKERSGKLGTGTIQVIPHITNEIKERVYRVGKESNTDIVITEIGGTVGDIESTPFIEAIRQVAHDVGRENVLYVHVTLVPFIKISGEIKTKPTQHSVKELLSVGIQPDVIVCRTENALCDDIKSKIALFCNTKRGCVISNADCDTLYEVPLLLEEEGLGRVVCERLGLMDLPEPDLAEWNAIVDRARALLSSDHAVNIALVGKYVELRDAYLSVAEALRHAGISNDVNVNIDWIDSRGLTEANIARRLKKAHGIIVPSGYGEEGTFGMMLAAKYARENDIPFFAEGLGMQVAVIEYARNVAGITDATSHEFDESAQNPVIINPYGEYVDIYDKAKQRLGAYPCKLVDGSLIRKIYNEEIIYERHRHHYEFNNSYRKQLEDSGLSISGISPNDMIVDVIELPANKFFIAVAFNPEFKSRPNKAHPLFGEFIRAAKR